MAQGHCLLLHVNLSAKPAVFYINNKDGHGKEMPTNFMPPAGQNTDRVIHRHNDA